MNDNAAGQACPSDNKFFWAVAGLLLLIVAIMAGLWLRSERRARQAEVNLVQQRQGTQAIFQDLINQKPGAIIIDRRSLTSRPAELDGRKTTLLLMNAGLGEVMGFQSGDLVLVQPRPATMPASAPADLPAVHTETAAE